MVRKANFVEVVEFVLFTEKGTKQKNGVCVNADEFNLDMLSLRKGSRDFIEGGTANSGKIFVCFELYRFLLSTFLNIINNI